MTAPAAVGECAAMPRSILGLGICSLTCAASCGPPTEWRCGEDDALVQCARPTQTEAYYVEKAESYFDTLDSNVEMNGWPPYSENVARWEWPPWLKLTAYTRDNIEATDTLLKLFPSTVPERECKAFDVQPFARCYVVFYYDAHDGKGCPIYEEFTFNDRGEMTWIEAWSDVDGLRPMKAGDRWAESDDIGRLATRIPGLGKPSGRIKLDGDAMLLAAKDDADVAEFVERANDWFDTWWAEYNAAGDDYWDRGCGWPR